MTKLSTCLIVVLLISVCIGCSDDGDTATDAAPSGDGAVRKDGPSTAGDGPITGDSGFKLGTNCKVASNEVIYTAPGGTTIWFPRIAWDGSQLGLAWTEGKSSAYDVMVARVDQGGKLSGQTVRVTGSPTAGSIEPIGLTALEGGGFAVVWSDLRSRSSERDLYLRRLDAAGQLAGEAKITGSKSASYPDLVRTGTITINDQAHSEALAVIWSDGRSGGGGPRGGDHELYFKLVDRNGKELLAEKLVTMAQSRTAPIYPRIAWDGIGFLAAWQDDTFTATEIYFTRISASGATTGGAQILSSGQGLASGRPDLTLGASTYGVTFSAGPDKSSAEVKHVRINKAGQPSAKFVVSSAGLPCTPGIGATGGRFAVAFQDNCSAADSSKMRFALIDDKGHPLKPDGTACTDPADGSCGLLDLTPTPKGVPAFPQLMGVGDTFYVTWMTGATSSIHLARITCTP